MNDGHKVLVAVVCGNFGVPMRSHRHADEDECECDGQIPQDNDSDDGVSDSLECFGDEKDTPEEYQN